MNHMVEQVYTETNRQVSALEKVVKTRNDFYTNKLLKQEELFKQQNEMFRELQRKVSEMIEVKGIEIRSGVKSIPTIKPEDSGLPDATPRNNFGSMTNVPIIPDKDEVFILLSIFFIYISLF